MIPSLIESDLAALKSQAEAQFYRACRDQLPADWLVLFSVPWIATKPSGRRYDGEADFIVFAPQLGFLVVEVKGGGVEYVPTEARWYSVDRHKIRHLIKDPFRQALSEKHAVIAILQSDAGWSQAQPGFFLAGHAVALSDVDRPEGLVGPQSPREILGGRRDLAKLKPWLEAVLRYWAGTSNNFVPLTTVGIAAGERALTGRLQATPTLSFQLQSEERVRLQLTEQQSRVLRGIGSRKRAAVCGGAGTGKTVLAFERALSLARSGKKTLLLCFNRLLADSFKIKCQGEPNLFPMTFHQLCEWRVAIARSEASRDLLEEAKAAHPARSSQDLFDIQWPYALALSTDVIAERFDAIVIDEGQDFKADFWLGIELLLADDTSSYLYVFYDQNQRFYSKSGGIPIKDEPYLLSFNCRNTGHIHKLAYGYFDGEPTDPPPDNHGTPVDALTGPSLTAQASSLHSLIVRYITQENIDPNQIAVLVCGQSKEAYFAQLRGRPLPRGVQWCEEAPCAATGVRLDTVRRFKGLEADIVFLWGIDSTSTLDERELLYVGMSRAKSRLTLVGRAEHCRELLSQLPK